MLLGFVMMCHFHDHWLTFFAFTSWAKAIASFLVPADYESIDIWEGTIDFSSADRPSQSRTKYHVENYPYLTIKPVAENMSILSHIHKDLYVSFNTKFFAQQL